MTHLTAEIVDRRKASESRRREMRLETRAVMQNTRERLTSSSGLNRSLEIELISIFAKAKISASLILVIYTAAIAAILSSWSGAHMVVLWTATSTCAIVLTSLIARRFLKMDMATVDTKKWQRQIILWEAFQSAVWSSIMLLVIPSNNYFALMAITVSLLIYASASTVIASSIKSAIPATLIPIILSTGILIAADPDPGHKIIAMLTSGACLFQHFMAKRLHETTLLTIGVNAEKEALFAQLEEANAKHEEARRRAEGANLAKSRFLATMSHELRTPLNAILGFSEVMKSELFGPHSVAQYKDYSEDIHQSGQHLLAIINEVLDLSRIEAGRYELHEEQVNLSATVDDCTRMLDMRARGKSISINSMLEDSLPTIWADERALRQIVINLLANAIKFTPPNGAITVKAGWTAGGGQYVSISDTGPGIPEDELPTVLETFGRGELAIKTAEQGTGLGLPIVKGLVELHGGHFDIRSRLREGTTVTVIFPAERVMETMQPVGGSLARHKPAQGVPVKIVDDHAA
jgi:two-component system, cell cycle sensor histidine kinase PleC